jgi:tetratricopeptide (TPR) repeat protein
MKPTLEFKGVDAAGVLFGIGRNREALRCLDLVLGKRPHNREALLLKATILSHDGRHRAALGIVNQILRLSPTYVKGLVAKGEILYQAGRNESAVRIFRKLLRLPLIRRHDRQDVYSNLTSVLITQKKFKSAADCLQLAISQFPGDIALREWIDFLPQRYKGRLCGFLKCGQQVY